jgi:hypothetical protein
MVRVQDVRRRHALVLLDRRRQPNQRALQPCDARSQPPLVPNTFV